jgi:hypothetical protein
MPTFHIHSLPGDVEVNGSRNNALTDVIANYREHLTDILAALEDYSALQQAALTNLGQQLSEACAARDAAAAQLATASARSSDLAAQLDDTVAALAAHKTAGRQLYARAEPILAQLAGLAQDNAALQPVVAELLAATNELATDPIAAKRAELEAQKDALEAALSQLPA